MKGTMKSGIEESTQPQINDRYTQPSGLISLDYVLIYPRLHHRSIYRFTYLSCAAMHLNTLSEIKLFVLLH